MLDINEKERGAQGSVHIYKQDNVCVCVCVCVVCVRGPRLMVKFLVVNLVAAEGERKRGDISRLHCMTLSIFGGGRTAAAPPHHHHPQLAFTNLRLFLTFVGVCVCVGPEVTAPASTAHSPSKCVLSAPSAYVSRSSWLASVGLPATFSSSSSWSCFSRM